MIRLFRRVLKDKKALWEGQGIMPCEVSGYGLWNSTKRDICLNKESRNGQCNCADL